MMGLIKGDRPGRPSFSSFVQGKNITLRNSVRFRTHVPAQPCILFKGRAVVPDGDG